MMRWWRKGGTGPEVRIEVLYSAQREREIDQRTGRMGGRGGRDDDDEQMERERERESTNWRTTDLIFFLEHFAINLKRERCSVVMEFGCHKCAQHGLHFLPPPTLTTHPKHPKKLKNRWRQSRRFASHPLKTSAYWPMQCT